MKLLLLRYVIRRFETEGTLNPSARPPRRFPSVAKLVRTLSQPRSASSHSVKATVRSHPFLYLRHIYSQTFDRIGRPLSLNLHITLP